MNKQRAIMHIPHIDMLIYRPIKFWIDEFEKHSGRRPDRVVLPAVGGNGPIFETEVADYPQYAKNYLLPEIIRQTKNFLPQAEIWCSINMCLPFLEGIAALRVLDNFGVNLNQNMCSTNPTTQAIVKKMIHDICQYNGVDGVVLDCTDLYPQAASNMVQGEVQNTCFCIFCRRGLIEHGLNQPFEDITSLFVDRRIHRCALHISESGDGVGSISVNLRPDGKEDLAGKHLYAQAKARKFVSDDDNTAENDAEIYIDYVRARVSLTSENLKLIGSEARTQGKKVATILGEGIVDLTTMCDLYTLQSSNAVDEVWFGNDDGHQIEQAHAGTALYLMNRATYTFTNLVEILVISEEQLHLLPHEHINRYRQKYRSIGNRLVMSNQMAKSTIFALSTMSVIDGFVGLPIFSLEAIDGMWANMLERNGLSSTSSPRNQGNDDDVNSALRKLLGM